MQHACPKPEEPVLRLFDGFPYLVARVVPEMRHFMILPGSLPESQLLWLAWMQNAANRLEACLVLAADRAFFLEPGGGCIPSEAAPRGGIPVTGRLALLPLIDDSSPECADRRRLLDAFVEEMRPDGFLCGDLTKGGRPATAQEKRELAGFVVSNVPKGLTRCERCGEWRGQCLDPSPEFAGLIMEVHCRCENHNRCARCGELLAASRLNANYFDPSDGQIWHMPGFSAFAHVCPDRSQPQPPGS